MVAFAAYFFLSKSAFPAIVGALMSFLVGYSTFSGLVGGYYFG
jgi:hypothetical protein